MISPAVKGYLEGLDVTQVPADYLTYPTKNIIVYKGKALTRGGLKNDGFGVVTDSSKVHSEFTWKAAPGGAKTLRLYERKVQVRQVVDGRVFWITIFSGLREGVRRVRFASWVDTNGAIIKSRLFFVDGGEKIYEWNGGIGTVASIATATITFSDSKTLLQLGFDAGNVTQQDVKLARFTAGALAAVEDYTYSDSLGGATMELDTTPSPAPAAGDLVISGVIEHSDKLTGFNKDEVYTYKNQVYVANLESTRIYYSHAITKLLFTIPASNDKTAITADFLDLDGNFTAMIGRKNVLWISTVDDWFKITKTTEVNAYGFWTEVEKFEQAERTGARPFAVAIQKGDIIFMASDKTLRRITSLEIIGTDEIQLISEGIDGLLLRLELDDVRIYYDQRYIFVISANEGVMLMLDVIAGEFMPPQYLPISCMSIIDGVRYGHHSVRAETYELFSGRNDLGVQIEAFLAPGYVSGQHEFRYKHHQYFATHGRGTPLTNVRVEHYYEESGAKAENRTEFEVGKIKTYDVPDDVSFGSNALATRSFAGVDDVPDGSLKPFFVWDRFKMLSWFNYRPVFIISGIEVEFHLLGWYIDDTLSDTKVGNDLFIEREA